MNQTTKIILAVIVTAVIVGGSVYYWQTQNTVKDEVSKSPIIEETVPPVKNIEPEPETEESIITNNWQNYQNSEFGFKINYPREWVYAEFEGTANYSAIGFGTPESKTGGYIWGITIRQPSELERVIAQMGDQFEDRKESRSEVMVNKNITGTMVTVTTNKYPDWISKTVYFENNGQLFAIGNGAIDDDRFETFYKSFEFAN